MKNLFSLFISLFLILFFPTSALADEGWVIDQFQSDIAIQESGKVRVVETITVDFGSLEKHGIYRDIPYIYTDSGKETYTEIDVESVQQDNKPGEYDTSRNDGYVRIKIGDANQTISEKHTYTITYTATGVLRGFGDHDELYWNVTGNYWDVPITSVQATVTLPQQGITQVACYEGYTGSQTPCTATIEENQIARFEQSTTLAATQGLTAVVGYEKGIVPLVTVERPKTLWEQFLEWPSLVTVIVAIVGGLITVIGLWYRHGRDFWFAQNIFGNKKEQGNVKPIGAHETVTVEFTAPEKLRPAEIGVLMDERADTLDVVATIIDLAARGYLTITEIPKKWLFGKVDYELTKKEPVATVRKQERLRAYEQLLLDNLFHTGETVKVSSLKQTFYDDLKKVKDALYAEVVKQQLFPTDPEKVRSKYLGIGLLLLFGGIGLVIVGISIEQILLADIAIGFAVSGLVLSLLSQGMPRRTAYGRELYRRTKGYRLFVNTAEKHRQQFFEKKNMFNEVLPYAMVFGLTEKFAKQMSEMGIKPEATGWYTGVHPITSSHFASNMSSFSSSLSTAMASTPSSSGGFSGGSSGGGFGGGGGGSW